MEHVDEGMRRVAKVADRVGIARLAEAAGIAPSTVRSFRDRGWQAKSLQACEKLIAAADRLDDTAAPAAE
jgi:hypothetical protein